jgi:hypothetical protein
MDRQVYQIKVTVIQSSNLNFYFLTQHSKVHLIYYKNQSQIEIIKPSYSRKFAQQKTFQTPKKVNSNNRSNNSYNDGKLNNFLYFFFVCLWTKILFLFFLSLCLFVLEFQFKKNQYKEQAFFVKL